MSGLVGLVPLAELLAEVAGSKTGATALATQIIEHGLGGLPGGRNDLLTATAERLRSTGVVRADGVAEPARAAELIVVCEVLASAAEPTAAEPPDPRLVLTVPPGVVPISDGERLEGLVLDVIRQATTTLHIGGAFWNDGGFELLGAVLGPAVLRGVETVVYVNEPDPEHRGALHRYLAELVSMGSTRTLWFAGSRPRMLHAKFVIGDRGRGYLGTANLTSWGMREHIEAGVELIEGQCVRFVQFLDDLESAGLFIERQPEPERS